MRFRVAAQLILAGLAVSVGFGFTSLPATVVAVDDGDTLWVQQKANRLHVRLFGVDAPELAQPFGRDAKEFTSRVSLGQRVTVELVDSDRYGRFVGKLNIKDGDLSSLLVAAGFAWYYRDFANDKDLEALESLARSKRIGLWSESAPVAPWVFRRANSEPPGLITSATTLHGNIKTRVFHTPRCKDYDCLSCTAQFSTARDALAAGFRPHATCNR